MPDILIRGMEMPQNCRNCEFGVLVDTTDMIEYKCYILKQTVFDDSKRLKDCPLYELPEHGDLISREQAFRMMLDRGYQKEAAGVILEVPTVIPSNKEETE